MTKQPPLRSFPRVHAAWQKTGSSAIEHAASVQQTLCDLPLQSGEVLRHRFEDVARAKQCAVCQALSNAGQASDLLTDLVKAAHAGMLPFSPQDTAEMSRLAGVLLLAYGHDDGRVPPHRQVAETETD